jgi:hypothetical protein
LLAFVLFMEIGLEIRGIHPSLLDSQHTWVRERSRLDALGAGSVALVGSSRILLDVDAGVLRHESGLEPVQLGIEGGSFVPVLAGLAGDPAFKGTVIVELDEHFLAWEPQYDTAYAYELAYERTQGSVQPNYEDVENYLGDALRGHLRSYADGTRPLTALLRRIITKPDPAQYLRMLPDREVLADYRKTPMPELYLLRSLRNLDGSNDLPEGYSDRQIANKIEADIAALRPVDNSRFLGEIPVVGKMVGSIQARGGRVFFVKFPESGYVEITDDRRYPRRLFWDQFAAQKGAATVDFEDYPALEGLPCPDGSHLDYRERAAFTHALDKILRLENRGGAARQ